jgi:NCAIR mutase (PurE)-related protein
VPRNDVTLDLQRHARIGLDEAVFCGGKTPEQIAHILERLIAAKASALFTRLDPKKLNALPANLRKRLAFDPGSWTAFLGKRPRPGGKPRVAVLTAGTSDGPVAREAARTLAYYGVKTTEIGDIGVAGLWRLLKRVDEIRRHPVVIVVAGMDAALPSVVGGLAPGAVIAVPTSVGYGVAKGGETALRAALASCAPGVTVVNIDNGYGAACAALRILGAAAK